MNGITDVTNGDTSGIDTTGQRAQRGVVAFLLILIGLATAGVLLSSPPASAATHRAQDRTVAAFNDGFAAAKQDDCGQGSRAACAWIMEAQPASDRQLPEWFRAYAFRYRHGPHAAPCILVGAEFHPHKRAAICADGAAVIVPRRMIPARPDRINPGNMPHWFHWWGTDRNSAITVAGFRVRAHARLAVVVGDDGYLAIG